MKKLLMSALSILVICLGLLYSRNFIDSSNSEDKQTLTIFNWGEYIDPELIKKFEQEISKEVLATKVEISEDEFDFTQTVKVEGFEAKISLKKA